MKIALTYDDGPNDGYTENLLDVLAQHDAHATFFMVGKFIMDRPDIAKRVAAAGHLIGNHTVTHPRLPDLQIGHAADEIVSCEQILTNFVGEHSDLFRPPFILTNPAIESLVIAHRLRTVLFQASAGDGGEPRGVDFMFDKIIRELNDESGIILMHDGSHIGIGADRADTVALTDRLLTHFKNAEFVFPQELL